jgi:hypothetical protein
MKDYWADQEEADDTDYMDDTDKYDADDKKMCLSFKFPNFEVAGHWPCLICFMGLPWFQDMQLRELWHLVVKTMAQWTNQHNTELSYFNYQ